MDVNSYRSGFCEPNNEWIWGVYNDASETIWYLDGNSLWLVTVITLSKELMCALIVH